LVSFTKLALVSIAVVALAAPVMAASPAFTVSGSYLMGDVLSADVFDACLSSAKMGRTSFQEGFDSNCVDLPAGLGGLSYGIASKDLTGTADVFACFYGAAGVYLGCPKDGVVPAGSLQASISSLTGYAVEWTMTVG
jgi:hypothetical protein